MTIKELAKLADVSIATVSKIMNNKDENISPVTREKVLRIAQQHNYSPYAKAISKAFPKTQLVGVVVPDISDRLYLKKRKRSFPAGQRWPLSFPLRLPAVWPDQ